MDYLLNCSRNGEFARLLSGALIELVHLVCYSTDPFKLLVDKSKQFVMLMLWGERRLDQLERVPHSSQWIVDLVRNACGKLPQGDEFIHLPLALFELSKPLGSLLDELFQMLGMKPQLLTEYAALRHVSHARPEPQVAATRSVHGLPGERHPA